MNPKELEVLKIILRSDKPLALPDILYLEPTMVKSTVAAALAKLLKESMIEVAGIGHSGKVICRTYRATARSREFLISNFTDEYSAISDIISKSDLCISLLQKDKHAGKVKEEIAQLRAMLDKYEKENDINYTEN